MHECVLCCRLVSVCPSFTLLHCIQTSKDIVKLLSRPSSPIILVFFTPSAVTQFQGKPLQLGRKIQGGGEIFAIFDGNRHLSRKH